MITFSDNAREEAEQAEDACRASQPGARPAEARSILVVEDSEDSRELVVFILESQGFRVSWSESTQDALAILARQRFDLVLTDYNLPDATGAALIERAISDGLLLPSSTALLLFTASRHIHDARGVRVIHKPIDPTTLLEEVERAIAATSGNGPGQA